MEDSKRYDRNATEILPVEVWELVLDYFESTQDIRKFFEAFPELQDLGKENQFSWMIGDLMPLIMSKYLTRTDIFNCRLVSKRWRSSVETSLACHPDRLPYQSLPSNEMSEQHPNYSQGPKIVTHLSKIIQSEYSIERNRQIQENPFPSRTVILKARVPHTQGKGIVDLQNAVPMLKLLGQHIWYLSVDFYLDFSKGENLMELGLLPMFECLKQLPNLRSLSISGVAKTSKLPANLNCPDLPFQLETLNLLDLYSAPEDTFDFMIKSLCSHGGIKKLVMHSFNWNNKYAIFFPNLKELSVKSKCQSVVMDMMQDLKSFHSLNKLTVAVKKMNICEIVKVIAECQLPVDVLDVTNIAISDLQWFNWTTNIPDTRIKDLRIATEDLFNLRFEFLEHLPQLRFLELCNTVMGDLAENFYIERKTALSRAVYRFVKEGTKDWNNFAEVWKEIPKLQVLRMVIDNEKTTFEYRQEYAGKVFKSVGRKPIQHLLYKDMSP